MTLAEVMQDLESRGTEQNRKVYARHGIAGAMFGVSFEHLRTVAKRIGTDHAVAVQLWDTGNHDARVLATMIADPAQVDDKLMEAWVRDCDNYVITDLFSTFAARTKLARRKADRWSGSPVEFMGQAGWNLIGQLAMYDDEVPDEYFVVKLGVIEKDIHSRRNRTRNAMNGALCGIGIARPGLREQALGAARRIGKVEVDHGETGCKTPDAAAYIKKAVARTPAKRASAAGGGASKRTTKTRSSASNGRAAASKKTTRRPKTGTRK